MNTNFLLRSKLNLNVKGNNINRFIKRLKLNNIDILNLIYLGDNEINIKVYKSDYDNIINIKTIYSINILDYYGIVRVKKNFLDNKYIIIFILIGLICIYVLSNIIFSIDIITNDSIMSKNIKNDLSSLGIKKYNIKKNYNSIEKIKKELLNRYKNEIEWIEIENIGTKYIVRYEPRIINKKEKINSYRNIVAKKDAIIESLSISRGQIIKNVNDYVKKGDVIVSGYISLNNNIKSTISSTGIVYGLVWYKTSITYPYNYYEKHITGNTNKVLVLQFLNKQIELFNFHKYKTKDITNKTILKNNILPIKLLKQLQTETNIKNENNSKEELIIKAIKYSTNKIKNKLSKNEYIKEYKILSKTENKDSITLNIFYSVVENITSYQEIEKYNDIVEK